jgi:hypothetical protein
LRKEITGGFIRVQVKMEEQDEEEEDTREEMEGGEKASFMKDEEVEVYLRKKYHDAKGYWPGTVDLSRKEEEYCSVMERNKHPEPHPPYLFTGKNCRPPRLAELLLGERCKDFEGDQPMKWMSKEGKVAMHKEISEELMKVSHDNGGIKLTCNVDRKKMPNPRWQGSRIDNFYCEECYSIREKLTVVVRVQLKEERREDTAR